MKKAIIYSVIISLLLIGGAYYYLFILQSEPSAPEMPSKVKIVMPKITSLQTAKETEKPMSKDGKKDEVKKQEPKEIAKEDKKVETKKTEQKKEEPKKVETKETAKDKKEEVKKDKEVKEEVKKKEEPKKPKFYQVVATYKNDDEAVSVKDNLISLGYHTARLSKKNGLNYIILSPFTDYYEAEFVRKNIEIETKRKEFRTKGVY
ncbi:MAG: hypothetical protein N2999_03360 [Proteobacteria bacterium]|nr:hypothetical protein [Pseudomonadota bacterium]